MRCARHPNTETALTCAHCGTPICPDCLVQGPVGMLCRKCARVPEREVRGLKLMIGGAVGLAAATLVGFVLLASNFFLIFAAPVLGGLVGEAMLRATKRRADRRMVVLAGACVVLGAVIAALVSGAWRIWFGSPVNFAFFLLGVILTTGAACAKIRYF